MAVGVHPHHAARFKGRAADAAAVVSAGIAAEGASAIGEIGLDYHYDFSPQDTQQAVFSAQVSLARKMGLPIVIHTREAADDTFRVLRVAGQSVVSGIFHCFTGDVAMAQEGTRSRVLHQHLRDRDVPEIRGCQGRRGIRAGRSAADRDGFAVPGPDTLPGQAQRACFRGTCARNCGGRCAERVPGRSASNWSRTSTPCGVQLFRRSRLSALTLPSQNQYCGRNCNSTASL